ncbi:MAG: aldolase [Acidobacteria bacterium]|nr:aldolase [Acidobacteriota bacterium]MBI3423700.1 aldolase [Acidobacteriota bacterium]
MTNYQLPPLTNGQYSLAQARVDLSAALRWAARLGLNEGICNHFSLVAPGWPDCFLVNPQGLHWSEITPNDLVLVDVEGAIIQGRYNVEATAFHIHGRIHAGKLGAACVLHTHMPYATALAIADGGCLEWASQNALRFYGRVAYDECYNGLVLDGEEGDRICAQLEKADVLFMANHGVIVAGASVAQAFDDLYYLERACRVQVLAQSTGKQLRLVPDDIAALTGQQIVNDKVQPHLHLEALKRLLDRDEPGWRG